MNQFPYNQGYPQSQQQQYGPSVIPMKYTGSAMNNPQSRSDPFQIIQGRYKYEKLLQQQPQVDSAQIQLDSGQQLRVDVPYNHSIAPTISLNNQQIHYSQYHQWNNNLLDLINKVVEQIKPKNQAIQEVMDVKNAKNEDQEINNIKQFPLNRLLPGVDQSQFNDWLRKSDDELLQVMNTIQEICGLKTYLLTLVQENEILSDVAKSNNDSYLGKLCETAEKNNRYKDLKNQYLVLASQCKSLSERFEASKVKTIFERQLDHLEEEAEIIMEQSLQKSEELDQDLQKYIQKRKQYHKLRVLTEKFTQQYRL